MTEPLTRSKLLDLALSAYIRGDTNSFTSNVDDAITVVLLALADDIEREAAGISSEEHRYGLFETATRLRSLAGVTP